MKGPEYHKAQIMAVIKEMGYKVPTPRIISRYYKEVSEARIDVLMRELESAGLITMKKRTERKGVELLNISVALPVEKYYDVRRKADEKDMSMAAYIRSVLWPDDQAT
jgi:hypothetical protein